MNINNNLIALFMGYNLRYVDDTSTYGNPSYVLYSKNGITSDRVFYDTSLDELYPVVLKIRKMGFATANIYNPDTQVEYFSIYDTEYRNTAKGKQFYAEGENCMYESVVKFIKWYNQNLELSKK
jgi:hypothetical protein